MSVEVIRIESRRFNAAAAKPFLARVAQAFAGGAATVILDFSDVASMDSLGISALVAAHRVRPQGTRIVLSSLNDYVRDVLEITQMFRVFDVYESADAAVKAA
ncbi:MAG TPA: STAS domain-containing protein [Polyangiaceae bacterium]|jgi:anti-sigma B factor antagonist